MEDEILTLDKVCVIIPGYAFKSSEFSDDGSFIAVKIKDITPPTIDVDNADKVTVVPNAKFKLSFGDYVLAMTGATIGKVGRLDTKLDNVFINQRVCKFEPNSRCDKDFLYYVLSLPQFREFILNNVDSKLAQPNIGHPTLYKYPFKYPSLNKQIAIANVLSSLDKKIRLNRAINQNLPTLDHSSEEVIIRCVA